MSDMNFKASAATLNKAKPYTYKKQLTPTQIIRWTVLFLGGVAMIMPIVFMMSTSFKWPHEIYNLKIIPDESR